ncbi:unnamed protein product [Spirodela intermedia]|uniref:Uncharacterized protein n=2 Tax=Spirodela intermedia TaxID=51605 RepID=A0A7I8ITQ4_SPIIN|nr:unnamed protein product [Spirodela intermedia]CAA6661255.1 unnamed protein product [Spirodela intermedia]CAA7397619.1 unnamed protein product [Spirodela intermedia]
MKYYNFINHQALDHETHVANKCAQYVCCEIINLTFIN